MLNSCLLILSCGLFLQTGKIVSPTCRANPTYLYLYYLGYNEVTFDFHIAIFFLKKKTILLEFQEREIETETIYPQFKISKPRVLINAVSTS